MTVMNVEKKVAYFSIVRFFFKKNIYYYFSCNGEMSIAIIKLWPVFFFKRTIHCIYMGGCKAVCQLNKLLKPSAWRLLEVNNVDL